MSVRRVCATRLSIGPVIVGLTLAASAPLVAQTSQVSPPPRAARPLPSPELAPPVKAPVPLRDRDWDTMSVEITVRQWQQLTAGEAQPSKMPATRYRVERSMASGQWKTVITIVDAPALRISTPTGPTTRVNTSRIVRIENDEDGSPLRYFNQRGERVVLNAAPKSKTPQPAAPAGAPAGPPDFAETINRLAAQQMVHRPRPMPPATRDWAEGLVASRADRSRRKQVVEQSFGPVVGQLRGLDRVVRVNGRNVDELLVDPDMGVPVEANTMRDGQLVSRRTFAYDRNADGDLVRRAMRAETLVPGDATRHAVIELEFNNLTFERGR